MTKVVNKRNHAEYELLSITETGVKLKDLSTGKEKMITNEVYNRWYEITEQDETPEAQAVEDVSVQDSAEETTQNSEADVKPVESSDELPEAPIQEEQEKPKKRVGRPKKEKVPKEPKSKEPSILKSVLEKIVLAAGCTLFNTKVKGFVTVKVGGHMAMAYTYSTKGIVLWMRSKAIEALNLEENYTVKTMKHMFDRRLAITENTEEMVDVIRRIVAASVEYQNIVNTQKEVKIKHRQEYLKEKERKREEKKKKDMEEKFGIKQKKNKKVKEPVDGQEE